MILVKDSISIHEVIRLAEESYGDMVKGVVDICDEIIVLGGEYHADGEATLLTIGSRQENIWGFNLYPRVSRDHWIEYTSLINIRPKQRNSSYEIRDIRIRNRINEIIFQKIIV